jgi:HK97 family phage prohead protease
MEADFSGYATKTGLKCTDGRTITPQAFEHMDGMQVPLFWQHGHSSITNVLGHVMLESRKDGVYAHGFFNDTDHGRAAKALVQHGDIKRLSIYANELLEKAKNVLHGAIREVSLVVAGANPGAFIDQVRIQHNDGDIETLADEAIIHTGETFDFVQGDSNDVDEEDLAHAGVTAKDVYESMNEDQKKFVQFVVGTALEAAADDTAEHSDDNDGEEALAHQEGTETTMNVFETSAGGGATTDSRKRVPISRDDVKAIMHSMVEKGTTLKAEVQAYAMAHGVTDIDLLFPDAKSLDSSPQFDKRRTEWVDGVLNGTRKAPFTRIKSLVADLTQDEARAKGYITGEFKKEEWFGLTQRTTGPTTVYKKQKLDRDVILDITDFDIVAWIKAEMRLMLLEELAAAVLIGDGRAVDDEDKIKDPIGAQDGNGVRSILHENELYAATVNVQLGSTPDYYETIEQILLSRHLYKGTGTPDFYTTTRVLVRMLLSKDALGRRRWNNKSELAQELMVNSIIEVEAMERETDLLGIMVNMADYTIGTDRGGETTFFDDFNIDYNKYTYLYETRCSGAMTKIRAALIIMAVDEDDVLVTPTVPTFVSSTGVVTIVATTGVVYKNDVTNATLSAGAQSALAAGATLRVRAEPAAGYYLANNVEEEWSFTRDAA